LISAPLERPRSAAAPIRAVDAAIIAFAPYFVLS
jgi:hypothetical protein